MKYQIVVFQTMIDHLMDRPDLAPKIKVLGPSGNSALMFIVEIDIQSPVDLLDIYYAGREDGIQKATGII